MHKGPVIGGPRADARTIEAPSTWDGQIMVKDHSDPKRRKYAEGRYVWHSRCYQECEPHWHWITSKPGERPRIQRVRLLPSRIARGH